MSVTRRTFITGLTASIAGFLLPTAKTDEAKAVVGVDHAKPGCDEQVFAAVHYNGPQWVKTDFVDGELLVRSLKVSEVINYNPPLEIRLSTDKGYL